MHTNLILTLTLTLLLKDTHSSPLLSPRQNSRFQYYNMPTAFSGPCDLTTGPDGAIWASDILVNKVARVDPNTGSVEEFDIPYTLDPILGLPDPLGRGNLACVVQPGSDGMLYAASGLRNQLVKIDPTTKNITVFSPQPPNPLGNLLPLNDLWRGPEGMFFTQTSGNTISEFNYRTQKIRNWTPPTPASFPVGIYVASDRGVWFCEFAGQKIGRLNATTGEIKEFPVPLSLAGPAVLRAETEGRYLWFTAFLGNAVGRIDMFSGEVRAFPNSSPASFPTEDTVDAQGNVWFSTATQNTLNKLTAKGPNLGRIERIRQPGTLIVAPISVPPAVNIAVHYGPRNSIWFTDVAINRVGRYQL